MAPHVATSYILHLREGYGRVLLNVIAGVHIYLRPNLIYIFDIFDWSASYCVQRSAAAGGIFSCFIHELINGAQIALLSIPTNAQPACVCLLRHSSLLAEGHRKQHKLSIQLHASQKIWHDIRTYGMIKSLFILRTSPVWSLLRAMGIIFPRLGVCLNKEPAGLFFFFF